MMIGSNVPKGDPQRTEVGDNSRPVTNPRIQTAFGLLNSVRIPDITMELANVAGAFPDYYVLSGDFGLTAFTR